MADSLATLIKLAAHKVEGKQQQLAQVEQGILAIFDQQQALDRQIKDGFAAATNDGSNPMLFEQAENFARRAKSDKERLALEEQALTMVRDQMLAELRALFAEQKRYEILHENQQRKDKKRKDKKQQDQLDEVANMRVARTRQG
jgi:flagellar export protein FliJ